MKNKVTIVIIILIGLVFCWIYNTNDETREDVDYGCPVCKVNAMNENTHSIFIICLYDGDIISIDGNDKTICVNSRNSKDLSHATFIKHSCDKAKYIVKHNSGNTGIEINVIETSKTPSRELRMCSECKKEIRKRSGKITNPLVLSNG